MAPTLLWNKQNFSTGSFSICTQSDFENPFPSMPEHSVTSKRSLQGEEPGSKGTWMEVWLLCLVRMRKSPATPQGVQLSWFCSTLWVEFEQEFIWQIKASCLLCLAGDDIFLSFLTVMVFIQFLPSSHGHYSHLEVQFSVPVGACSLLAATSAARAVVLWLERHWPG